jgi:hypothetical protein
MQHATYFVEQLLANVHHLFVTTLHVFGNLPALLDNHNCQIRMITRFLCEQLHFKKIPEDKDTVIRVMNDRWPKCLQLQCSEYRCVYVMAENTARPHCLLQIFPGNATDCHFSRLFCI